MNKIYKVVWNKVRNCYVAVSEMAKRNGKGGAACGAVVKGGAKAGRGLLALSFALCVTAGVFVSPGTACADTASGIIVTDAGDPQNSGTTTGGTLAKAEGKNLYYPTDSKVSTLAIKGGNGDGNYFAGYYDPSGDGELKEYNVSISGGTVSGLYGGYAEEVKVEGNTVNIDGGTITASVHGGYVAGGTGDVVKNTVNITNTPAVGIGDATVCGGGSDGSGNVKANAVNISNGKVGNTVYGGRASGKQANVTDNTVVITSSTVSSVTGGLLDPTNGSSAWDTSGSVMDNKVTVSSQSVVNGDVIGGCLKAYNSYSSSGSVTGNTVTISGSTVNGSVYGGFGSQSAATGNTVVLLKPENDAAPVVNGTVYGGWSNGGDAVTGNTLQLKGNGLSATGIQNFETIKLVGGSPDDAAAGTLAWENGATVLKAGSFLENVTTDAGKKRASLDITGAEAVFAEAAGGSMTLLASDTEKDFKTLSLIYSGGTEALSETNLSKVVKTGAETPEATPVNGVTVTSYNIHTVSLDAENSYKNVLYTVENNATKITLGEMAWGTARDLEVAYTFEDTAAIDAAGLTFTGAANTALKEGDSVALVSNATGITTASAVTQPTADAGKTVAVDYTDSAGIGFAATAAGHVAAAADAVNYVVDGVTLDSVDLENWNGTTSAVPEGWTAAANGVAVETDGMTVPEVEAGKHIDILQADTEGFFDGAAINGANAWKTTAFTESDPAQSVTVAGSQGKGVTLNEEKNHLIYKAGTKDVDTVTLGKADFAKDATLLECSGEGYNYANVKTLGTDGFAVSFASPETAAAGDTMTLLQANKTLADMAAQAKTNDYSYTPVSGVRMDARITGSLAAKGGAVTYRAEENRAQKLTFTDVDWKDSGALLDHKTTLANVSFNGADVDTAKIHFKNIESLKANKKMTLVSGFGDSVGTITGNRYTVGTGLEGEGAASLTGSDLIFTAKTGAGGMMPREQTHKTLMAALAGMGMLAAGSEHVGMAMAGLAAGGNGASDGASTFASVGGGASRYETGSHVNTHMWNALVAVGGKKELDRGTLQYGLFGEYGRGNYTLHSSAGRGDGDAHYAGGGLLVKWTGDRDVYTEAGVRLGRMRDTASDVLSDGENSYGYNVRANYYGAHVGIGKLIRYKGGRNLDVYGKYFYTKRDGVDFTAGGSYYDLDSVASSVLRVGARYGSTDRQWNWYGGLAFDYEFDGEATGKVDGVAIRSASVKGGSARGELGLRMDATKTNPWCADISVYGYGGKHRGFGGNVSVAYTF